MTKKNPVLLARQRERALALKISELLKKDNENNSSKKK